MTPEQAKQQAFLACVGQVAWSSAGGFISGSVTGGVVNGVQGISNTGLQAGTQNTQVQPGSSVMEMSQEDYTQWLKSIGTEGTTLQTLDSYHAAEYNNSPEYQLLKKYGNSVQSGKLSPLVGFDLYKEYHSIIELDIVGMNVNNVQITGSQHIFWNEFLAV